MPLTAALRRAFLDSPEDEIALIPGQETRRDALRNLAVLRTLTPPVQGLLIAGVDTATGIPLLGPAVLGMLLLQVAVAALTWLQIARHRPVRVRHVVGHALLDIALFFGVLFHTGGAANPFSVLIVLPYLIASSALAPRWVLMVAAAAVVSYLSLRVWAQDLVHPDGVEALYRLHVDGILVTFVLGALLLAIFVNRMNVAVRRNERALSHAMALQARNDSVTAVGALAAGYAHELGSPLGTMALIIESLQRRGGRGVAPAELRRLGEQVAACKHIVSQLAEAGGRRRAEAASAVRVDRFVEFVLGRVRDLHPAASLVVQTDPAPPPVIVAEESLRQALLNIVENAVQASPHAVQVQARWTGARLTVVVSDAGPGFPDEVLRHQGTAPMSTRRDRGGHGLGLMLAATTLDQLEGRLHLENRAEGGARVTLEVPLAVIGVPERAAPGAASDAVTIDTRRPRPSLQR